MTKYLNEWSNTPGSNNFTQPDGWPEGITSDKINNIGRETMAVHSRWEKDNNGSVVTTGTQPAYLATLNQSSIAAYYDGLRLCLDFHSTNAGGAPTLDVNSIGAAKALVWPDGTALVANDITADQKLDLLYDGTNFQVLSSTGSLITTATNTFTGTQIWSKGADIASADPLVLGTDGNYFDVTGTTTIASITVSAGTFFMLQFDGALQLTHGASLVLPGDANITTVAGDRLTAFATAADTVAVMSYIRAATAIDVDTTPRSYLAGLTLSNDTDTEHDINVTAGVCKTADGLSTMTLATEQTKQIDASWATGNDAGGFPSSLQGVGVIANTWYHVHLFTVGSTVEVGFDSSITAANLIADHGGTAGKYRRIGSVLTDGTTPGNIIQFLQYGDEFIWMAAVNDYTEQDPGTAEVTTTLSVPTGLNILAKINSRTQAVFNTAGAHVTTIYPADITSPAAGSPPSSVSGVTAGDGDDAWQSTHMLIRTNTSAQIQHISSASIDGLQIWTLGWFDDRGRNS